MRMNKLPTLNATVLSVGANEIRVRYAEDAEMFAGLVGLIRLPRTFQQGRKQTS